MLNTIEMLKPRRKITGMSAILLPFLESGDVDWSGFRNHVERTVEAGLVPAVNMDTGYANLIDHDLKLRILEETKTICAGKDFVAGAFVADQPGSAFSLSAYQFAIDAIVAKNGWPIIFQSYGLTATEEQCILAYQQIGEHCQRFLAFELGQQFAPFGKIYSLTAFEQLLNIPACVGAKHSSLSRMQEWQRLQLRDQVRPDFLVLTGNDLAIDMVMYGSDYLLGLSTFAPDLFAQRDQYWLDGDPRFYELNDALQYLGFFAFRDPVPAYKHTAAMFLKLRKWISQDRTHPLSPTRPGSDREILQTILVQLQQVSAQ